MRDDHSTSTLADAAAWCRTYGEEHDDNRPTLAEIEPTPPWSGKDLGAWTPKPMGDVA